MYVFVHTCTCVGNEEEEESLKSFYAYEATDDTAVNEENDEEDKEDVEDGHQSPLGDAIDNSFIAESQASPKCSAMLRNKVKL